MSFDLEQIKPDLEKQVTGWAGSDASKTAGLRIAMVINSERGGGDVILSVGAWYARLPLACIRLY